MAKACRMVKLKTREGLTLNVALISRNRAHNITVLDLFNCYLCIVFFKFFLESSL